VTLTGRKRETDLGQHHEQNWRGHFVWPYEVGSQNKSFWNNKSQATLNYQNF
jgi:hypothetical protein